MTCLNKTFRRQESNQTVANCEAIKSLWLNPTKYGRQRPDSSNLCFKLLNY